MEKNDNTKKKELYKKVRKKIIISNFLMIFLMSYPWIFNTIRKKINYNQNEVLLNSYNDYLEDYTEEINSMELEDIDIFVKVMKDIQSEYEYKKVEKKVYGYERLVLYENKCGVCLNMADDCTAKINSIDSKYNATNLEVYLKNDSETSNVYPDNIIGKIAKDAIMTPNHLVTLLYFDECPIILDPTNLFIGTIKNGKIILFNSDLEMEITHYSNWISDDFFHFLDIENKIIKSYKNDKIEKLNQNYGKEAVELSLQKIKKINK